MRELDYRKTGIIVGISCFVIGLVCLLLFAVKAAQDRGTEAVPEASLSSLSNRPAGEESFGLPPENEIVEEPEPEPQEVYVNIMAVGDDLFHMPVVNSGLQDDGTYNFDHLFTNIAGDLAEADIKIMNQETVLGGVEIGLSEYPQFNSPQEVGDALAKAGFNVIMHANNHAMDRGYDALAKTMDFWKKYPEIVVVGVNETEEDQGRIRTMEIEGYTFAFLNHTFSLNGIPMPGDKPWLVDMLEMERVEADVLKAREIADFVVALPHWGIEYVYEPSANQVQMAQFMADLGVDLIIGTHPHVIEPVEWLTGKDGNRTLVYYSLGNYVSNQDQAPRMLGGMAKVTVVCTEEGVAIQDAGIELVVTHYEAGNMKDSYAVYKLDEYTEELAAMHGVRRGEGAYFSVAWMERLASQVLGEWYPYGQVEEEPAA